MKKIYAILIMAMMAVCAQAQVYLGGTVGLASVGHENGSDETTFKILPEVGYTLNNSWAIGTTIGYEQGTFSMLNNSLGNDDTIKGFTIAPYARWTFMHSKMVNLFLDMGFGLAAGESHDVDFTAFNIGVQPGVAVNLNNHFSFVGKVGFLGYSSLNPEGEGNNTHALGLDVNGNNITFGLYYNF